MSDYLSLPQVIGSSMEVDAGTTVRRAHSGKPRIKTYYSQGWATFTVVHELDLEDKDDLLEHYEDEQFNAFNFTWTGDSVTYSVRYGRAPQAIPIEGNIRWRVSNLLIQV